jgi:hypothetical protein
MPQLQNLHIAGATLDMEAIIHKKLCASIQWSYTNALLH